VFEVLGTLHFPFENMGPGKTLIFAGHMFAKDKTWEEVKGTVGRANMDVMARKFLEMINYDYLIVCGGPRTTGARAKRGCKFPRPLWFARRRPIDRA